MMRYTKLQSDRRKFLALTGLTLPEFQLLLTAFTRSYERLYLPDQTLAGRPRQRYAGGGRKGVLHDPEQKLLLALRESWGKRALSRIIYYRRDRAFP